METKVKNFKTLPEIAALFGISKSYLYKKTMARIVPHFRIGQRLMFDVEEFESWFLDQARREAVK